MQYTDNYSLRKPQVAETASVADINYNTDRIDGIMADDRQISLAMYVSGNTYNTGDLVGYENPSTHRIRAYRCLVDNVTGVWDSTKWTLTNLAAEIIDAKQSGGTEVIANPTGTAAGTLNTVKIDDVIYEVGGDSANQNIADAFSELQTYAVGDYCIYESILYKCTTAVTTAGAWDSTKWESCVVTDEMGSGGGGSSTFAGLSDVNITNPASGQVPCYDATTQKWINASVGSSPVVVYHADWIASASSAVNTKLTQTLSVPKGKYIGIIHTPVSAGANNLLGVLEIGGTQDLSTLLSIPPLYGRATVYFELSETKQVVLVAATGTTSYTWDSQYLDRGGMDIIDVSYLGGNDNYSTTERVVGTWIDDSLVYEKTLVNTADWVFTTNTWSKSEFNTGDIQVLIDIRIVVTFNNTYSAHSIQGGFVDGKLAGNCYRAFTAPIGSKIIIRYTKSST